MKLSQLLLESNKEQLLNLCLKYINSGYATEINLPYIEKNEYFINGNTHYSYTVSEHKENLDEPFIRSVVDLFHTYSKDNKITGIEKNIGFWTSKDKLGGPEYSNLRALYDFVKFVMDFKVTNELKKLYKSNKEDFDVTHRDSEVIMFEPFSHAASVNLGKDTTWCISNNPNDAISRSDFEEYNRIVGFWDDYKEKRTNIFFLFCNKLESKYQKLAFIDYDNEDIEIRDKNDELVSSSQLVSVFYTAFKDEDYVYNLVRGIEESTLIDFFHDARPLEDHMNIRKSKIDVGEFIENNMDEGLEPVKKFYSEVIVNKDDYVIDNVKGFSGDRKPLFDRLDIRHTFEDAMEMADRLKKFKNSLKGRLEYYYKTELPEEYENEIDFYLEEVNMMIRQLKDLGLEIRKGN